MSLKFAIFIMTTVAIISVTSLGPSKAEDELVISKEEDELETILLLETMPSPDLWAGPETQFFQSKLHGGHGGRFHFNGKRDTYQNLRNKRAANNMPVSSSVAKFLEPEKSAGQAGATGEGGGLDKSRAV